MVDYVDLPTMKLYMGTEDTDTNDALLQDAITSASREVEDRADRVFTQDAAVSEREFDCYGDGLLLVDDISTTVGLLIEGEAPTDAHKLLPRNGVVAGRSGHPFTRIKSCNFCEGETYTVTARWGWVAVPDPVIEAVKMIASETYFAKNAPFGVAGETAFGPVTMRERKMVEKKLRYYYKNPVDIV